jgi:RNA polymerase sigma-70 factor (ECF subfamily)
MTSGGAFPATQWTLILAAGEGGGSAADEALAELCRAYWFPVYAFIRRLGNSADEAQDLTQEFFARFLERRHFTSADPARGRFRSFLLTCVKHFLVDEADRRNAEKRGGRAVLLPLELRDGENHYEREFADNDTPERLFERTWARTLMARVNENLRSACAREGRGDQFEQLRQFLPGADPGSYSEVARDLGASEGALKVAVHRMRRRYREMFRGEIANLVSRPDLVDDEVRYLLQVLRG